MIGRNKKLIFNFFNQGAHIKEYPKQELQIPQQRSANPIGGPSYRFILYRSFILPTTYKEEIELMMNSFYRGSKTNGGRRIDQLRWDKMTIYKDRGGLNIWDLRGFNLSMLGKQ